MVTWTIYRRLAWRPVCVQARFSVLLPAWASQSDRSTGCSLPPAHRTLDPCAASVVIVAVFVAQRQAEDPLSNQCLDPVLDVSGASRLSVKQPANRRTNPRPRSTCLNSSAPAFEVMSPPSKPATTSAAQPLQIRTTWRYTLSASGPSWICRKIVLAQHVSQILSPDAPLAFEKSRLEDFGLRECGRVHA